MTTAPIRTLLTRMLPAVLLIRFLWHAEDEVVGPGWRAFFALPIERLVLLFLCADAMLRVSGWALKPWREWNKRRLIRDIAP